MAGKLSKIIIRGYEQAEEGVQQGEPIAEFEAMFNPESFGVNNVIEFDDSQAESETGSEFKFKSIAPRQFSFDFVIDATGANVIRRSIEEQVNLFKEATGFKELAGFTGTERRTFFLSITWGSFHIRCVLKDMEIKYTLFRPDGSPIRATISATFNEYKTPEQQSRENPESIVNLTQVRDVLDQDQIGNLAKKLYGDSKKFMDIAKANGLNNLKELTSGVRLNFPPIDQLASNLEGGVDSLVDDASRLVQGALEEAQGINQTIQTVSRLADSAVQQAETAIQQGEAFVQQAQAQVQSALQQGQGLANQLSQTAGQGLSQLTQGVLQNLPQGFPESLSQGLPQNLTQEIDQFTQLGQQQLSGLGGQVSDTIDDLTQLFDF